ncbi:hypothetical protein PtrV1_11538 [Pyrenophora tritici-repentis]|nr:hypothetical protein PtrV1_11538 [Pyrenophora tritici-repentis]
MVPANGTFGPSALGFQLSRFDSASPATAPPQLSASISSFST